VAFTLKPLTELLDKNRAWAQRVTKTDPDFFKRLSTQQAPRFLWIGCSDSRVPANEIVDLLPGELFVHRNVANIVVHSDLNCLSVLQFAVDVLKVKDVIVCGHYGCSGVHAALTGGRIGLSDNWLRHVQDVREKHRQILEKVEYQTRRDELLCELNVIEQTINVNQTTVVREARERGQAVTVHGWVYGLKDGLVRDLAMTASSEEELLVNYREAIGRY